MQSLEKIIKILHKTHSDKIKNWFSSSEQRLFNFSFIIYSINRFLSFLPKKAVKTYVNLSLHGSKIIKTFITTTRIILK